MHSINIAKIKLLIQNYKLHYHKQVLHPWNYSKHKILLILLHKEKDISVDFHLLIAESNSHKEPWKKKIYFKPYLLISTTTPPQRSDF